jgi:hypothetical protein
MSDRPSPLLGEVEFSLTFDLRAIHVLAEGTGTVANLDATQEAIS